MLTTSGTGGAVGPSMMVSAWAWQPDKSVRCVVLIYGVFSRRLAQVAEWQTRTVQVRVSVRTWGFNSPLAHSVISQETGMTRNPHGGSGLFCLWGGFRGLPVGW